METQILSVVNKVFQVKGMFGVRIKEIAEKVNLNMNMLHYYFKKRI